MPTPDEIKQQQRDMWSASAGAWDRYYDWLEAGIGSLTDWICDAARVGAGDRVLDLACGTGQPAANEGMRVAPGGRVVATDLSPAMVEATRRRVEGRGLPVDVRVMDAESIDFPDASFDAVTCRFGLMFCPDPVRAVREIHRVLKPGGRFAVTVWDEAVRNPFFTAIGKLLVSKGLAPPPDPNAPGVFRLAPASELDRVLRAGGFSDPRIEALPVTMQFDSPEEYWNMQSEMAAPLKAAISRLDPAAVADLRAATLEVAKATIVDGKVNFGAVALAATGAK